MAISSQSSVTLQNVVDNCVIDPTLKPMLSYGGFVSNKVLTIANDVMEAMMSVTFPWKWSQFNLPLFYSNSWQQDYALLTPIIPGSPPTGGASVTNLAWLTEGIAIQINNSSTPKPWSWVEVGRRLSRSTATTLSNNFFAFPQFVCSALPNAELYYGTWGAAQTGNATWGNNPQPHQLITNPIGNASSQPSNPICQIQDANGNFLVVTSYGTTGSVAPLAAVNAKAGTTVTDNTVTWTVVDAYGYGIRVQPVPSQTGAVWQFNIVGQLKPTRFTNLNQPIYPIPDDFESTFRQGFKAQLLQYAGEASVRANFDREWTRWTSSVQSLSLQAAKQKGDRERDEDRFVPESTVMGAGSPRVGWLGAGYPYGSIIG
jgi:hypothetical protein